MRQLAFSAKPNRVTDGIMKSLIFDRVDSRTSECFKMHLIILAVVAFGLTETLNYVFNFGSGGECVYPILSYRPAALNTLNRL